MAGYDDFNVNVWDTLRVERAGKFKRKKFNFLFAFLCAFFLFCLHFFLDFFFLFGGLLFYLFIVAKAKVQFANWIIF